MSVLLRYAAAAAFLSCAGCCIFLPRDNSVPATAVEMATPDETFHVFREAALRKEYWRAYCCFAAATQERLDWFDFAYGARRKKYRKAFREMVIVARREVSREKVEYLTNYAEPFDVFEMVWEDDRWKIDIPERVFEED